MVAVPTFLFAGISAFLEDTADLYVRDIKKFQLHEKVSNWISGRIAFLANSGSGAGFLLYYYLVIYVLVGSLRIKLE